MHIWTCLTLVLLLAHEGNAVEPERDDSSPIRLMRESRDVESRIPEEKLGGFYHEFTLKSRSELERHFFDSANPLQMQFFELRRNDPDQYLVSRSYVSSALKYSLREMVVAAPLVEETQEWLGGFIRGVIGNTTEEKVEMNSRPELSYSEATWRQTVKDERFLWGVRLFRWPNPYAYVSGKLGHLDGEEIVLWHVRYYLHEFKGQRVEALVSMPLPEDFYISAGLLYAPTPEYKQVGRLCVGTVRLEKWFADRAGAIFAGVELYNKLDVSVGFYHDF